MKCEIRETHNFTEGDALCKCGKTIRVEKPVVCFVCGEPCSSLIVSNRWGKPYYHHDFCNIKSTCKCGARAPKGKIWSCNHTCYIDDKTVGLCALHSRDECFEVDPFYKAPVKTPSQNFVSKQRPFNLKKFLVNEIEVFGSPYYTYAQSYNAEAFRELLNVLYYDASLKKINVKEMLFMKALNCAMTYLGLVASNVNAFYRIQTAKTIIEQMIGSSEDVRAMIENLYNS